MSNDTAVLIRGRRVAVNWLATREGQALLLEARDQRVRPLCLCREPAAELVVRLRGHAYLARMPGQRALHSAACERSLQYLAQRSGARLPGDSCAILELLPTLTSVQGQRGSWEAFRGTVAGIAESTAGRSALRGATLFLPPTFSSADRWQGPNSLRAHLADNQVGVVVVAPARAHALRDGQVWLTLKHLPTERFMVSAIPEAYPCLAAVAIARDSRPYVATAVRYRFEAVPGTRTENTQD